MGIRKIIEKLNDNDVCPLKIEDSNTSHDVVIFLYALEAGTLHDIFEDIILISTSDVIINGVSYDYPVWLFYSAKSLLELGIDLEPFKYSLDNM